MKGIRKGGLHSRSTHKDIFSPNHKNMNMAISSALPRMHDTRRIFLEFDLVNNFAKMDFIHEEKKEEPATSDYSSSISVRACPLSSKTLSGLQKLGSGTWRGTRGRAGGATSSGEGGANVLHTFLYIENISYIVIIITNQ